MTVHRRRRLTLAAAGAALCAARMAAATSPASAVCAACHREIYESYEQTPMARSSGIAGDPRTVVETFARAAFRHAPTGFRYRVYQARGSEFVEFDKAGGSLHGSKKLAYFIGSGATARSYAIAGDGFLFEAPVAYYSGAGKWDLAPGYQNYAYPYLTRPVVPTCLNCHASGLEAMPRTQNRYATPPFAEAGIACERCHGPGDAHVRKMRAGETGGGPAIVNPAKLDAVRRDSVCAQCHLTGEVRVMRAGQGWQSYRPGDRLDDSVAVFVRADTGPGMKVTSHVEKLAQSACQRGAGDRLWCGTCHDPHATPSPSARAAWFRGKCLGCHDASACRETRAARAGRQDDCTSCHMPKTTVADAQHVVYTDHSIPRRPRHEETLPKPDGALVAFGGGTASARDLALAYAIAAPRTHSDSDRAHALALLRQTERLAPDDVEVLLYLAEIYRNSGQEDLAVPLYRRAIRLDPAQVTASVGLGGIMMERGDLAEAIRLWQDALAKNAGLELVRTNLAMAQARLGDLGGAASSLEKAVELNPGFSAPAELLKKLRERN